MGAGDIVRYKQEFLSSHTGIGYPFSDVADSCGEVISVKGSVVKIRWDHGGTSSSLIRNIERADWIPSLTSDVDWKRQDLEQKIERAEALIELTKDFFATR